MTTYKGLAAPLNAKGVFEAGLTIAKGKYLRFSTPITSSGGVPTTGLSKGDMFLVMASTTPQLAVCVSAAGNGLKYFTASTSTFGRASTT